MTNKIFAALKNIIHTKKVINLVKDFHKQYYYSEVWRQTFWFGISARKCPLDLWIYQEILNETKPDVIIETGTAEGGSALFLAHMLDLLDKGKIITVDIVKQKRPEHKRITYLTGSSVSAVIIEKIKLLIKNRKRVMVILDSDHSKAHVLKELEIYSQFITKNDYLIVEDTNLNGHPVCAYSGPGPMEALNEFLKTNHEFTIDKKREKFRLTFNPMGFLRKIK